MNCIQVLALSILRAFCLMSIYRFLWRNQIRFLIPQKLLGSVSEGTASHVHRLRDLEWT